MFNKKLFLSLIYLLCLSSVFMTPQSEAATCHAILIGDTIEGGTIELATECNLDMFQRQIKRIAIYTELKLNMAVFEGLHVSQKNILKYFRQLDVGPNDVIILACFAHGSRDAKKLSKWPDMHFTLDRAMDQPFADFGYFIKVLQRRKPRLLLAFNESCNQIRFDERDEEIDKPRLTPEQVQELYQALVRKGPTLRCTLEHDKLDYMRNAIDEEIIQQYRHLFLEASGSILTSSSSPSETSLRDHLTGGIYTCEFLKAFHETIHLSFFTNTNADWQTILETAALKTLQHPMQQDNHHIQTPQFELILK